ncbi:hypothetical protein JF66_15030 [Cryobacterium sp. MLB-32]|uniref:CHAT domain-containing protein n=1 Tax=Cryobacterium sp. MLB-32 TaxID=1529318 RepID=UPI0004E6E4E4|nr:CHAT domain-containing protein [Cryobacterium sp. MLB-32]KFF58902.1 hypothetical protein JF66_15030 [Cryobacterium sp. MLB-32]
MSKNSSQNTDVILWWEQLDRDIELLIRPGSTRGDYRVDVVRAPTSGRPSGTLHLDVDAILDRLPELELTVLASAAHGRRAIPVQEQPLHDVGKQLFEALFSGSISAAYHASQGAVQQSGQQLRLVLRLAAPELAALPWETLYDPEDESYLCRRESLLRHIPASDYNPNPMEVDPPLRVLGIVAAPRDLPPLDTDAEKLHLTEALTPSVQDGLVELVWAPEATWDGIQAELRNGPWHVVHFIGHGDYDVSGNEGRVALVSPQGRSHMVEASGLADLLREASPSPRLVVLNSCSSGESGQEDLFSASAAALVRGGISAVAAMQFTVSDGAAIAFARGFYGAIAAGREVDEAAGSGRRSILGLGRTLEWVTPVLYVRGGSTRLFTIARPARRVVSPVTPPETAPMWEGALRQSTLRAMYIEAKAKARIQDYLAALSLLDDVLELDPDFREADDLRNTVRGKQAAAQNYRAAREAEEAGDWAAAIRWYARVENDAVYPDAAQRRVASEMCLQVSDLQNELRYHADEGNWQAVLEVDAQLRELSSTDANLTGSQTARGSRWHNRSGPCPVTCS